MLFKVVNNRIEFKTQKQLENFHKLLGFYNNTGKYLKLSIVEYEKDTTVKQHKLWQTFIGKLASEIGYSFRELELEYLKLYSIPVTDKNILGQVTQSHKKVQDMSVSEFGDFFTQVKIHAEEFHQFKF